VSLRRQAARGTLVNTAFLVAVNALGLVRGFVLARFLTRTDYGLFGIVVISLGTLLWLRQGGIGDKYVQQREADQELAFQRAFTLEALSMGVFVLVFAAAVPLVALAYGRHELLGIGYVCLLMLPALALQAPLWIHYRRMAFARQRTLQAVDPVVSFAVAVGLAAAGAGYWAPVAGVTAGAWAAALVAVWSSPYRLAFRYDRGTLRSYLAFSWPLALAGLGGIVVAQGTVIAVSAHLGVAATGVVVLAATVVQFADRLDQVVSGTLYPAVCAVADRPELLLESFVKTNRLALMWALPFGAGLALFAGDLVHHLLGDRWAPGIPLLRLLGLSAAVGQLAFNWDSYLRARGTTRPIGVAAVASAVVFFAVTLPLLLLDGLTGVGIGLLTQSVAMVVLRLYYLRELFGAFAPLRHVAGAVAPVLPGVAAVLLARAAGSAAIPQLILFAAVVAAATWALERELLREAAGYVRGATA
jgi:O-antigen/teichoic acid export membrane protein